MSYDPPLSGVRILDLSTGPMTAVGRLLADLGAQVTVVRLAGVSGADPAPDVLDTAINRRGLQQVDAGAAQWQALLAEADILIENTRPASESEAALNVRQLRSEHPAVVVLSISDFGRDNEFREWQATTPVLHALSSELTRSGIPGKVPLVPPARQLPYHVAAAQAAVMVVSVFLDRLRTGEGDLIDFSVLDGAMQTLDPPYGSAGTAAVGVAVSQQLRNWIAEQLRYPILKCADGYIRICLLAKRQWHGMFEWMGRPEEFADPKYDKLRERFLSSTLMPAIAKFFRDKTRAELEAQAQQYRVPTARCSRCPRRCAPIRSSSAASCARSNWDPGCAPGCRWGCRGRRAPGQHAHRICCPAAAPGIGRHPGRPAARQQRVAAGGCAGARPGRHRRRR
jgi:crotonobetainyl-CoA:carnitine CoA-transferase CaiB-like acyl-CoA transferase